jgi:HD superfamily phosphodiesterase
MSNISSALAIPDSALAKEATGLLRESSTDLLFNHSIRVYLFAAEQGRQQKLRFDPELLYLAAAFHDFGLIKKFSSEDQRFEVDGANVARQFLTAHNVPQEQVRTAWEAIALHTTPGISFLRRCAMRSWPSTLAKTSKRTSFRRTSAALRTSPPPPTAP